MQLLNLLGALAATALLPFLLRAIILPEDTFYSASINALIFNAMAVLIAFWTRLSIETYPGNRSTDVILTSIVFGVYLYGIDLMLNALMAWIFRTFGTA